MTEPGGNGNYSQQTLPPVERKPLAGESLQVDVSNVPLAQGVELWAGQTGNVVGLIEFGQQHIALLDTGEVPEGCENSLPGRYALVRANYDSDADGNEGITFQHNENGSLIGNFMPKGESAIVLGRKKATEGYGGLVDTSDGYVSSTHLGITFNDEKGTLTVEDKNSTNGSAVIARKKDDAPAQAANEWWVDGDPTVPREELLAAIEPETSEVAGSIALSAVVENPAEDIEEQQVQPESAQSEAVELNPDKVAEAVKELSETWGLPEGTSLEMTIQKLDKEANDIITALTELTGFEDVRAASSADIREGLKRGGNALAGSLRDGINNFLGGKGMQSLTEIAKVDGRLLSPTAKRQLRELTAVTRNLRQQYDAATQKGRTWFNHEAGAHLKKQLDVLPRYQEDLKDALRGVQEMQIRVKGSMTEMPGEKKKDQAEVVYRNEQMKEWADELAKGDVTPERLEEITSAMEGTVITQTGMQDDPNSPYVWFGDRVRNNREKDRAQTDVTGRTDNNGKVPAVRYVAELMADIARGAFDPNAKNINATITLDPSKEGGVDDGQHRAAALAMLYGNKDWQRIAKAKGLKIETVQLGVGYSTVTSVRRTDLPLKRRTFREVKVTIPSLAA